MPVAIEKEGKTVSEAIISACEELGISRDGVDVEVLEAFPGYRLGGG